MSGGALLPTKVWAAVRGRPWRRPYRPGASALLGVAFVVFVVSQVLPEIVTAASSRNPALALVAVVLMVAPAAWTWRMARVGVYTGEAGVKYAGLFRTTQLPWSDVAAIEVSAWPMAGQLVIRQVNGVLLPLTLLFKGSTVLFGGDSTNVIRDRLAAELDRHTRRPGDLRPEPLESEAHRF